MKSEHIPGGTVFTAISALDPGGSFWVRCNKHKDYTVQVLHNYFETLGLVAEGTIFDEAVRVLAQCPECPAEKTPIIVIKPSCPQEEHDACGCAR